MSNNETIIENVARGLRNMTHHPDAFIIFETEDVFWEDGDKIHQIPVYQAHYGLQHLVDGDEECQFVPIWKTIKLTREEQAYQFRLFALAYSDTGDF
jgi:hypothetical protein